MSLSISRTAGLQPTPAVRLACLGLILAALLAPAAAEPLRLQADTDQATAGYFVLDWQAPPGRFELRERRGDGPARVLYSGPDTARLISGRPDGEYHYQIRRIGEPHWSEAVSVTVEHHPLSRALGFFGLGALVFLATLLLVVRGAHRP
jgi:hypothetical protein